MKLSPLFQTIIDNHNELTALRQRRVIPFSEAARSIKEKRSLMCDAERALSWNRNKGNTA